MKIRQFFKSIIKDCLLKTTMLQKCYLTKSSLMMLLFSTILFLKELERWDLERYTDGDWNTRDKQYAKLRKEMTKEKCLYNG